MSWHSQLFRLVACLAFSCLVSSQAFAVQFVLPSGQWQMLSLPGEATGSVAEIVSDQLPVDGIGVSWAIFTFDTVTGAYQLLDGTDQLEASQAFWMIQLTDQELTIDLDGHYQAPTLTDSALCASAQGCVEHELAVAEGVSWTLIGAPFTEPTAIGDIRLQAANTVCADGCTIAEGTIAGYTNGIFYQYDAASNQYTSVAEGENLVPGEGYWFANTLPANASDARLLLPQPSATVESIFSKAARLGKGINLGNALEAPQEGEWGITLESYYFDRIADAGFDSVRVPVRWSAHAMEVAPYTINPAFFERVDWVLEQTERVGLAAVINVHHYEALMQSPDSERERFLAIWSQIADRYSGYPDNVFFELLNEPTDVFNDSPSLWNELLASTIQVIRLTNPTRALIVGPVGWNAIDRLPVLALPLDDQLITTVHYYDPFEFTHQGADWVDPVPALGTAFDSTAVGLGSAFQDWSWDTQVSFADNVMNVAYSTVFAGLNFNLQAFDEPVEMSVAISGPVELGVGCSVFGVFDFIDEIVHTGTEVQTFTIDLTACGSGVETVALQNRVDAPVNMTLVSGQICDVDTCYPLLQTAADAIRSDLAQAARFGALNNTPVFVGEFGAYSTADMDSRADWTETVQTGIESLGMTSSYWEFGAGFGAFDIENDQWRQPLLDALLP